jgi:adenylate kinase
MGAGGRFIVLGKQGAGKGTQAVRLAERFGVPHISTGDMFRAATRAGTEFGKRAQAYMDRGELVPDEVVIGAVAERFAHDDVVMNGFVLDGFPRTRSQAEELDMVLGPGGLEAAIDIVVPTDVVLRRLSSRRVCVTCGTPYSVESPPKNDWVCDKDGGDVVQRKDDTEAAIRRRLELYEEQTGPLVQFYEDKGLLVPVDGEGPVDEVFDRMLKAVGAGRARTAPGDDHS